jgi:hypothetical protein
MAISDEVTSGCTSCANLRSSLTAAQEEIAKLTLENNNARGELAIVDEALDRRPALADLPDRYSKVYRACSMAGRAEAAESALAAAREEIAQQEETEKAMIESNNENYKRAEAAESTLATLQQSERKMKEKLDYCEKHHMEAGD